MTLQPHTGGTVLVRLEHLFEVAESNRYSGPVTVQLSDFFGPLNVSTATEVTLSAVRPVSHTADGADAMAWTPVTVETAETKDVNTGRSPENDVLEADGYAVTLLPMQIRTFLLK
jgi:lysosomal alpha-mannosidase